MPDHVWDGRTCVVCEQMPVRDIPDGYPRTWREWANGGRALYCAACFERLPANGGQSV